MECKCDNDSEDAVSGWWLGSSSSVQMGAFSVVGAPSSNPMANTSLLLFNWSVSSLELGQPPYGTLRGIQSLFKWLSRMWRFIEAIISKFKAITGSSRDGAMESKISPTSILDFSSDGSHKPDLRLILLGPAGGGRSSLTDTLSGSGETRASMGLLMESTKRTAVVDGRKITVIDTPDLLGLSLGNNKRAREALRSLQLVSPGPHAFLMVIRAPGSSLGINQDATQAIQATMELYGDGVIRHIILVLTHADRLGRRGTLDQMLEVDTGDLRRVVSLLGQKPELVDNRPDSPPEAQSVLRRQLVGRVMEMKELRGPFVHELQRREDHMREELLTDMASALARKLGHM